MPPTTTIETVQIVRPLKVIAFVCGCIAVILMIIAIASPAWLEVEGFRMGLWEQCVEESDTNDARCSGNEDDDWVVACAALCVIGLIVVFAAVLLNGLGLLSSDAKKKIYMYRIAMYLHFLAVLCVVIALIVFPAMFMQEIEQWSIELDLDNAEWYFAWAYGVAWGAVIFIFGSAILLLIDKETDELYYKEKTYYHNDSTA